MPATRSCVLMGDIDATHGIDPGRCIRGPPQDLTSCRGYRYPQEYPILFMWEPAVARASPAFCNAGIRAWDVGNDGMETKDTGMLDLDFLVRPHTVLEPVKMIRLLPLHHYSIC